jgi:hypothetical protein
MSEAKQWRPQPGDVVKYYDTDAGKEKIGTVLEYDPRIGSYPYLVSDPENPTSPWSMALGEMEPAEQASVCAAKCDHGSECLEIAGHRGGHETQHGCVFYSDGPDAA